MIPVLNTTKGSDSRLDWIEQGITSHSTHFRSFRRWWGDCGISQDCSHSRSPQCVWCWVVCARPLLITVVCMCIIWKAMCPYVSDARLVLWVSLEHAFTSVSTTNQAELCSSATHLLARWEHERTTARDNTVADCPLYAVVNYQRPTPSGWQSSCLKQLATACHISS